MKRFDFVHARSADDFERELSESVDCIYAGGYELLDVRYSSAVTSSDDSPDVFTFSAIVIYE